MAYTAFNPARPDGSTQNGAAVVQSIQDNQYALWTDIAAGMLPGWRLTPSGGTAAEPGQFLFDDGSSPSQQLKGVVTWGTTLGATGNITQIVWSVSQNSGGSFTTVCTQAFTYDTSGNLTSATGGAGIFAFFGYLLGRMKALTVRMVTAEAALAALGSMSLQDASAVAILGGSIKSTTLGGTGVGEAKLAYVLASREKWVDLSSGTPANTFTLDFAAGGTFRCAPGSNFTFAVTNLPANGFAQKVVVELENAAGFTATLPSGFGWGGAGAPTFTSGTDLITVYVRNHASTPVKRFMLSSYG